MMDFLRAFMIYIRMMRIVVPWLAVDFVYSKKHHIYHRDETGYTPRSFWKSILLYGLPAVIYMLVLS